MSFGMFDYSSELDEIVEEDPTSVDTLKKLQGKIGEAALPSFVIEYVEAVTKDGEESLAIHTATSIAGQQTADQATISRKKGFMGTSQLETQRFPQAVNHFKIFFNTKNKARLYLKFKGVQFVENLKEAVPQGT